MNVLLHKIVQQGISEQQALVKSTLLIVVLDDIFSYLLRVRSQTVVCSAVEPLLYRH